LLTAFAAIGVFGGKTSGLWDTIRSGVVGM
jgi:hypothetical protein